MAGDKSVETRHSIDPKLQRHHFNQEAPDKLRVTFHEYDVGVLFLPWCVIFPLLALLYHWGVNPAVLGWIKLLLV
ncbi:MAG: hypothetical protein HY006_04305, partial [Candidatus Sungbacteria bacterium]|nr:hypothetical protein [Candidatus Sungbacteria bacterium]